MKLNPVSGEYARLVNRPGLTITVNWATLLVDAAVGVGHHHGVAGRIRELHIGDQQIGGRDAGEVAAVHQVRPLPAPLVTERHAAHGLDGEAGGGADGIGPAEGLAGDDGRGDIFHGGVVIPYG